MAGGGSKPKPIDLAEVEGMASEFCTQEEIAMELGFERSIFRRRQDVLEAFNRGKNTAKMSLRHMMFMSAKSGDKSMMIFLAKNELQYRDNPLDEKKAEDVPKIVDVRPV